MKLQMTPRFPANVIGTNGIQITKANGAYTFSFPSFNFTSSSGTSSTSVAGPLNYNLITVTNGIAATGAGMSDGTNNTNVVGLRVNYITGGPNLGSSQQAAIFGHLHNTITNASGGDKSAIVSLAYSNVTDTGGGILGGAALNAVVDNGGSHTMVEGVEADVGINAGGTAGNRAGLGIWNTGTLQATGTMDAAIYATSVSAAGRFKKLIQLSSHAGFTPIATTGDFFFADTALTVANIFNCSNVTVTGNIASFPNLLITGGGGATFGANSAPPAGCLVNATVTSGGSAQLFAEVDGATGINGLNTATSLGTNSLTLYANEPSRSLSIFGQTIGNWASLVAAGAANNGMILGTSTAKPIIIGTNSAENVRVASGGNVGISSTAGNINPDALLTVNANTGATVAPPIGTNVHIVGDAAAGVARATLDGFAGSSQIFGRRADGTRALPTAVQTGDQIAAFLGQGYGATGYTAAGSTGGVGIYARQNFTDAAAGTYVALLTTPNGSTTIAECARAGDGFMVGTVTDPGAGAVLANTSIKSQGATSGIGYATGAGGAVTQGTNRTTGVTLNTVAGAITLFSAAGSATPASFTVTNSAVAATDVVIVNQKSGTDIYEIFVTAIAAGSFRITSFTTGGTTTEQPVFNFAVIKGVAA